MASAWIKRRAYEPGGPLYAMRPLRFNGVDYAKGDALPVAEMTPAKHVTLWRSGKASHAPQPAPSPTAPPPSSQRTSQEAQAPSPSSSRSYKRRR